MSSTLLWPTHCRKIKNTKFQVASNFVKIGQQGQKAGMDTHTTKSMVISCFVTKHTPLKMMLHKCVRMCTGFVVVGATYRTDLTQ